MKRSTKGNDLQRDHFTVGKVGPEITAAAKALRATEIEVDGPSVVVKARNEDRVQILRLIEGTAKMKTLTKYLWVMITLVCVSGCKTSSIEPVALEREDMCSYCKMAISEKQYAAEFIDNDGKVYKFDDIGCMVNFIQTKKVTNVAAYFVMDFERREWLKADDASFVRGPDIYTPMGGQMLAFKDKSRAQQAAEQNQAKLLTFQEVLSQ